MIEMIRPITLGFQEIKLETGVPRRLRIETGLDTATVCIVVRRSGKSTYIPPLIQRLLGSGGQPQSIYRGASKEADSSKLAK